MAKTSPMTVLRELAEKSLDSATSKLGEMRTAHATAVVQHDRLVSYQQEYREQLLASVAGQGVSILHLVNHSAFITDLGNAVQQQKGYVAQCEQSVDHALNAWRQDKKRFNAYSTLKNRADSAVALKVSRQEQKMMDEFAQRSSFRREAK